MNAEEWKGWRAATVAAIVIWIALAVRLMIADVWDETNGMLAFSSAAMTLSQKLEFVLTKSLGFWRPLPTLLVTFVLHFVRDFDVSWRVLRAVNIAMLVGTLLLMFDAATRWLAVPATDEEPRRIHLGPAAFLLTVALLFSGSAVITAGWYANIFDASALLLIAAAFSLVSHGHAARAGVVIAVAFFCKETTALALPFLLVLVAARRVTFRQALRCGIPAAIGGAIYFAIRSRIVPFGSANDVHQFALAQFWPTLVNLGESFWRQTLKGSGPGVAGFVWLALSLIALRRPRVIAAVLLFVAATAVIYWGMFSEWQSGRLLHHLDFVGRLYLIPVALVLFLLIIERRLIAVAILCIPIVFGGYTTWRDHARFQRTYKRVYRTARAATHKPLTVNYPPKPLDDTVRQIRIGDIPDAAITLDAKSGRLIYR